MLTPGSTCVPQLTWNASGGASLEGQPQAKEVGVAGKDRAREELRGEWLGRLYFHPVFEVSGGDRIQELKASLGL